MSHIPVLLEEVIEHVQEIQLQQMTFVDATFGRGGHTRAILNARPDLRVLGLDCDQEAIEFGQKEFQAEIAAGKLKLVHANFSDISQIVKRTDVIEFIGGEGASYPIAGMLLDLGVSSPQLDVGQRGFSFYHDGPLDMRMDQQKDFSAKDIINTWSEEELNDLFKKYGEVSRPYRVTTNILDQRRKSKFTTTGELAHLIEKTEGWRKKGHHPATNYFLALRLVVNQELERVEKVLPEIVQILPSGGRLLVITFHSLEDRLVKQALKGFAANNLGFLVNKKAIQATWEQKKSNPRSRSAILRIFERETVGT